MLPRIERCARRRSCGTRRPAPSACLAKCSPTSGRSTPRSTRRATPAGRPCPRKVQRANAEYERAKRDFDEVDQQYSDDLAAFQQRQLALEADPAQRQRAAGEASRPCRRQARRRRHRPHQRLGRADRQARRRSTAERDRLLADHDQVEAERAKLAKMRATEARLRGAARRHVGALGSSGDKRKSRLRELRIAVPTCARCAASWPASATAACRLLDWTTPRQAARLRGASARAQ
jgi:hypothetical protein